MSDRVAQPDALILVQRDCNSEEVRYEPSTPPSADGFSNGAYVAVGGLTPAETNDGAYTITTTGSTTFTYSVGSSCPASLGVSNPWTGAQSTSGGVPIGIASSNGVSCSGGVVTVNMVSGKQNFAPGESITVGDVSASAYDGTHTISSVVSSTELQFDKTCPGGNPVGTNGWVGPAGGPTYTQCTETRATETVHLAQLYGVVSTLEVYFSDLDNTANSAQQTDYADWNSQTSVADQPKYFGSSHVALCPPNQ